jgi:hypothetical protein
MTPGVDVGLSRLLIVGRVDTQLIPAAMKRQSGVFPPHGSGFPVQTPVDTLRDEQCLLLIALGIRLSLGYALARVEIGGHFHTPIYVDANISNAKPHQMA